MVAGMSKVILQGLHTQLLQLLESVNVIDDPESVIPNKSQLERVCGSLKNEAAKCMRIQILLH